jgi:S1-C subfamily serine protease
VSVLAQFNTEMACLADRVKASLVEVTVGLHGGAAGTIWRSSGLIVTNAHVIKGGEPTVRLPGGRRLKARLLAEDSKLDLAAIEVDAERLLPLALGDSDELEPGQLVVALGHPWGVRGAMTAGIVMDAGSDYLRVEYPSPLVAVNLPLRPGNSGGPLVDSLGRLVGINSIMTGPDTGLAIPVNVASAFLRSHLGEASPEPLSRPCR